MKQLQQYHRGVAHLVIIVVVVVVIIGALSFAAWRTLSNSPTAQESALDKAAQVECAKKNDKDLCKFFTSWEINQKYRIITTDSTGNKSIYEIDGNKSHIKAAGETAYETIIIDKTTYTKAGETWYKSVAADTTKSEVSSDYKTEFKEPAEDTNQPAEDTTVYKSLGKEACGKLTCFKYEITDKDQPDTKQFIWFDTKNYQLQHVRIENKDGVDEQFYEYTNINISEPSPVKELAPNQYIMPGQTEPTTIPSGDDILQSDAGAADTSY